MVDDRETHRRLRVKHSLTVNGKPQPPWVTIPLGIGVLAVLVALFLGLFVPLLIILGVLLLGAALMGATGVLFAAILYVPAWLYKKVTGRWPRWFEVTSETTRRQP
jgi:hypothetical protein